MTQGIPSTSLEPLQVPDLQRRARTSRLLWLAALAVLAALAAVFLFRREERVVDPYRAVPVERRDLVRVVEAGGRVDARARYEVPAPFAGRLTEILVKSGDAVKQGQALARLDARLGAFAVRNASAAQQAAGWHKTEAQSASDAAKQELQRVTRLRERGLASEQELDAAQSAVARAKATLEAARAQEDVAGAQLASARFNQGLGEITAPADGVVLTAPENLGSAVTPERALFVLGDPLERVRVDVDVSEADIGLVQVGQAASFEVLTFPNRRFAARVERLAVEPRRDGGVVTYGVRLLADNPDHALLPGMSATVKLEVARVTHVLAVRDAALRFTPPNTDAAAAPRSRVFVKLNAGELRAVPVRAGLSDGMYTEITPEAGQSLAEGAEVVVGLLAVAASGSDRGQPGISLGGK
ncbi:MAG TPA: efflux RND transporter periplasmic adaptor subunit [Polyangiales bacterium]|nr:efflux RND transporter periplasmic adaptor subunit [Polyangiales bacterium]